MRNLTQVSALPVCEDEDAALRACSNFWPLEWHWMDGDAQLRRDFLPALSEKFLSSCREAPKVLCSIAGVCAYPMFPRRMLRACMPSSRPPERVWAPVGT